MLVDRPAGEGALDGCDVCQLPCGRTCPGGHPCSRRCHAGGCGPCSEPASRPCHCGRTTIERPCCDFTSVRPRVFQYLMQLAFLVSKGVVLRRQCIKVRQRSLLVVSSGLVSICKAFPLTVPA